MFRSFKSKILFAVVALTTVALVAVTFMTRTNFELEVLALHEKLLRNVLGTVIHIVETKYDELLKYELDSIGRRRLLMESMTKSVISALRSDYHLYETDQLSKNEVQRKSLNWIRDLTYGEEQYFFVCNMNLMGLYHPVSEMIGKEWEGFRDLKQRDALLLMRDVILSKGIGYTVLEWPALLERNYVKQMVYFTYFPEWEWMVGTSVRIDDIEKDAQTKIDAIKRELENIITNIKINEAERIYLFDGNGNMIVQPKMTVESLSYYNGDVDYLDIIYCIMNTPKDYHTAIEHPCSLHNKTKHTDLVYVEYYQPMNWYLAAYMPGDAIYRPVGNLIKRQVYIITGILLLGIILAIFLSDRIAGRLRMLTRYARDLSKKDLASDPDQQLIDFTSRQVDDEIGELIRAFISMETQLRQTFRALTRESVINSTFAEMSSALIQSMHVDEISNLVFDQAKRLTGSEYGFVGYIDPGTGNLICPTLIREVGDVCQVNNKQTVFENFTGLWGWVLNNRKPLLTNSPSDDPRSKGFPHGHVRIDSFLSTPALIGDLLVGQISLANPGRDYNQQDLLLAERLAAFYALAVQRKHTEDALAHSRQQLQLLSSQLLSTQEEERRRIARDLHDSIGQSLAAIKVSVENALNSIDKNHTLTTITSLERIIPVVQNAMEEARRIYTGLRPSCLDDLGIIATISWFCRQFQKTYTNIWIEQQIDIEEENISEPLKIVIFRIVQEALNNIARHSVAEWVNLSLVRKDGLTQLTIEDNGIGFDLDSSAEKASHGKGLGITGMKERTKLAGGDFRIDSVIGEGTTIHASWLCQKAAK
jgi:signal transduction histidine kinase